MTKALWKLKDIKKNKEKYLSGRQYMLSSENDISLKSSGNLFRFFEFSEKTHENFQKEGNTEETLTYIQQR